MALHRGELLVTDWLTVDDAALAELLGAAAGPTRPALVLVDGGSGTGTTTAATRIAQVLDAPLVHTDDIAWHLDPIAWDDVLIEHVITPWRAGRGVRYRPDAWIARGREGAVQVPALRPVASAPVCAGIVFHVMLKLPLPPVTSISAKPSLPPWQLTMPRFSTYCLLYTSDAADERSSVDLGGRRIIKNKKSKMTQRGKLRQK